EKPTSYVVQAGDTLTGVASRFGLTNQQLASYNNLSPTSNLFAGVRLSLIESPASTARSTSRAANDTAVVSSSRAASKSATQSYTVKRGDTLINIAQAHETDVQALAALNNIPTNHMVLLGQRLRVPEVAPKTVEYRVQRGDGLIQLAAQHGISPDELAAMNNTSASRMLQVGERLIVPAGGVVAARSEPVAAVQAEPVAAVSSNRSSAAVMTGRTTTHVVKRGETLIGLASANEISVEELADLNGLRANAMLQLGQRIKVPDTSPQVTEYRVQRGDSLIQLASRYGLTPESLAAMNNMPANRMLQLGERLTVPAGEVVATQRNSDTSNETSSASANRTNSSNSRSETSMPTQPYTVKRGDTLIGIAGAHNVDVDTLAKLNGLRANALVQLGQRIKVPDTGPRLTDYRVRRGDTLARVAQKHGITLAQLAELNE
ncbi:MAG: LysM peptidoglycan-binding domain-containing protein, partial [Pseudomonadota bacterium]|nr:LysM peptidoglycan-binding domain-containing protein [Pseudomonadota bacterium]